LLLETICQNSGVALFVWFSRSLPSTEEAVVFFASNLLKYSSLIQL
jgi:hypothetical protein